MAPQSTIEMQTCSAPPIEGEGEGGASPGSGVSGLNSLNLINGYSGTVTVVAPLGVGTFNLTAGPTGAIAQPSTPSGNDITVTGTFTWTGGVLNNTPSNAYVNIKGGGTITLPGTGNTLTSGSTLVFASLGGIQVTTITGAGTLLLNGTNEDAIFVRADAKVQLPVQEGSDGAVKGVDNVNKKLTIEAGAFWGYVGSGTGELGLQVGNNGGRFYLTVQRGFR